MTLRVRMAAIMAVAVFVAFLVAASALFLATADQLQESLQDELAATAAFVAEDLDVLRASQNLRPEQEEQIFGRDTTVQLFDIAGTLVGGVGPSLAAPLGPNGEVVAGTPGLPWEGSEVHDGQRYGVVVVGVVGGAVRAARPYTEIEDILASLRADMIRFGIIAAGIAAGIGAAVANRITGPIMRLTDVAEEIAETGNLDRRIESTRTDEVGRLAKAFNRMIGALAVSREQQRRLVMDASHELRTPLTSLRTNLEVLQHRGERLEGHQREALLGDVNAEVVELSDLVGELVELATDQHTAEIAERIRLDELCEQAAERTRRRHGREVATDLAACEVIGRPSMLDRAVGNLLENADKWSPPGAPIRMTLDGGTLTVHDRGPGIAPEDQQKVFDRFYRSVDAQNKPGSGLGLAIVKQTVEAHGGTVFVSASPEGGAAVGFRLPGVRPVETSGALGRLRRRPDK